MKVLVVEHSFDLKSNIGDVQTSIAETIAKYDVVVVEDRLGEAKELMATFNKEKKAFSDKCKEFLKVISAPLDEFKAKQKEIEKMFDDGRAKIASQVEKFEASKLEAIATLVREYRNTNCESRSISINAVSVEDLIMLSAVSTNSKGYSLTKKTTDAIDQRIQSVENEILKARLEAEEKAKRDREIAEQARIEAEERARVREVELIAKAERDKQEALERAEREKIEAVENAKRQVEAEQAKAVQKIEEQKHEPVITDDGKRVFVINATFEILAPALTPHEKIKAKLTSMMETAGITSLTGIEVR